MSTKLVPYERYVDSGVDWLGQIPEGWKPSKLNYVASLVSGGTPSKERDDFWAGSIPWISPKDMKSRRIQDSEDHISEEAVSDSGLKYVPAESLLFVVRGMILVHTFPVCRTTRLSTINQDMKALLLSPDMDTGFMHFYLEGLSRFILTFSVDEAAHGTLAIRMEGFGKFPILVPPLMDQRIISTYLDKQTSRIDDLVKEQEELILLLKEKRQALISHAVTKGLNPKTRMKPSGVEWIGDIPADWEVIKFNHVVSIAEGQVDPETEPYLSQILIAPNHVESGTGRILALETASEQSAESGKYLAAKGNVIYSKIRPSLRKACLAPEDCLCSADMYPLHGAGKLDNEFLLWIILSEYFSAFALLESERVAMPKINRESLNAFFLPIPPIEAQRRISKHITDETSRIDKLISEAESTIKLMQEHRSALISSVVTGKVRVPT